jgi:hypothetical protein
MDYLILGAGWTSTFLIPAVQLENLSYAATTTTGRDHTLTFKFDPTSPSAESDFQNLPAAHNVLITFPLKGKGQSRFLIETYRKTHPRLNPGGIRFVQLGSSGIYQIPSQPVWITRSSRYDVENERAVAEDELRALGGSVLNLCGLWGGARDPRNWIGRVAPSREALEGKTSLHMIHGEDVARAIMAVFKRWEAEGEEEANGNGSGNGVGGERWLVTDGFVYDWWSLIVTWQSSATPTTGSPNPSTSPSPNTPSNPSNIQSEWIYDLMLTQNIRALPRDKETLGRCYDSREFWERFGLRPLRGGL